MRVLLLGLFLLPFVLTAQKKKMPPNPPGIILAPCTIPGTTPGTAIPVCGTSVFSQSQVVDCDGPDLNPTACGGDPFPSTRSFWYKFRCFSSGTLGFLITPNNAADDYDWILFDVTGHNPNDVFTDKTLVQTLNGAFVSGVTGCAPSGTLTVVCYSQPDLLNALANLVAGHDYLLMVTNFSNSPAGYGLSFEGGTAGITDGDLPKVDHIEPGCSSIKVVFSTDIKCTSVTPTGSEFTITPGPANLVAGVTSNCGSGFFAVTELTINLTQPLIPNVNYKLTINHGSDANTFKNVCDVELVPGTEINFSIAKPVGGFTVNPENCIGDPTNFSSTSDPAPGNTVAQWHWDFGDGNQTTSATASTSHTYASAGTYIVKHWIVNSLGCNSDTAQRTVIVNPLPTSDFTVTSPACETRTITFTDASAPNAGILTNWDWDFGDGNTSTIQSPTHTYASAGTYNAVLKVTSSKGCVKTATKPVVINARPAADFIVPAVCLADTYAQFTDNSSVTPGTISFREWNFGDPGSGPLNTSNAVNPTHSYTATGSYNVRLIVQSNTGCRDTIVKTIFVNGSFPAADLSLPAGTLCVNDSLPLTNLSTVFPGTITKLEIHWDDLGSPAFDTDNAPAVGKIYKHLYPNFQAPLTKTYTIRLVAYSGGICANEKSVVITVNAAPKVQFNALADTCFVASPFQLTQGSETGGLPGAESYTGPGVSSPAPGIYVFNPAAAGIGTHTIEYRFVSTAGCTDFKTRTIKVLDTAVANFSFSSPVCDKTAATFNELSVAPSGIVLSNTVWDFGDGSPLENHLPGSTFTHLFPAANTYTVKMYNVSANGCPSSVVTKQVTISPIPKPGFSVPVGVCLPKADMKFTNLSTIADGTGLLMTYSWDFGDGGTSTQVSPTHQYSTVGPFFVKLTARSNVGCLHDTTIRIDNIHPQPKAQFNQSRNSACLGQDIVFTDITNPLDGTTVQWNWDMGDGTRYNTPVVDHTYADSLLYTMSLFIVNSHGCNSDTMIKTVKVYPNPVVDAGPDRLVLQGGSVKMQPVATGVQLQYLWTPNIYFINGNNTIAEPRAMDVQNDVLYTLTVTARGGCVREDKIFVKVLRPPKIPNTFTPNNDGINDKWVIQYLDDYPDSRVQVFTRTGQLVYECRGIYKPWNGTFNGKTLPFDTYYYIIEAGNNREPITGYITILR